MAKIASIITGLREHGRLWFMRGIAVLILAFLFFIAIGGISQNDKWKITRVEVVGTQTVDSDTVEALVREKLKGNYYIAYARENSQIFPSREIEEGLLNVFPRLASAYVERIDAHTISVKVSERKPYALWCGEVYSPDIRELIGCFFVDNTGFVFDRAPTFSEGVYLEIYGALLGASEEGILRAHIPPAQFILTHTLVSSLMRELGDPLRIIMKPEGEMVVTMKKSDKYPMLAGVELRFKDTASAETIMKNLLAALPVQFPPDVTPKKKLLYIDMRFGNKIFFGFEN
ncbi:MAG: hypothetical protein A2937_02815 [Candidatus Yonathbacteria bacterium RIFCSPLOWO2_01_FULL_47_33b]|uniref:Uncharacterized protein n=1 Tax=Candidatus Yonathbacteria bacterium RIFCSPLOWO2_01_FULL_47_33b TaxID=1802727 RepID=A0A1G2SI89_9BACT|nr:MAG: hypothetical protein A2937_02815 [Candidatus Yonathbacteria bacterium RIFCSPLOWO2_01_FULL_47_33b]